MTAERRAILVGTTPLNLRGLRDYLVAVPNLIVVAEATASQHVFTLLGDHRPDYLFLQPGNLPRYGVEFCQMVQQRCPAVKLLILADRSEIDTVAAYANLGVAAYFLEDGLAELIDHLEAIDAGQVILDRRIARNIRQFLATPLGQYALAIDEPAANGRSERDANSASSRRKARLNQVMELLALGRGNREIARALGIAERTVAEYVERGRAKYGPGSRVAIARRYERRLLV